MNTTIYFDHAIDILCKSEIVIINGDAYYAEAIDDDKIQLHSREYDDRYVDGTAPPIVFSRLNNERVMCGRESLQLLDCDGDEHEITPLVAQKII